MDDRDDQIDEFCLVTGATRERAQFFLQASNGNLQAALDGFYNEDSVQNEVHVTCYTFIYRLYMYIRNQKPHLQYLLLLL